MPLRDKGTFIVPTYAGPLAIDVRYRRDWLSETDVLSRHHLEKLEQGHIGALTVGVDSLEDVIALVADIDESQGRFLLCRTPDAVRAAWQVGAIGIMLAPTFAAVGSRLDTLTTYRMLGAVAFAFSLNMRNLLTDGCGERNAGGLSHLGMHAVKRLERLGITIDVSHMSEAGFWDIVEVASRPITASHSNAFALCANARNLKDDQLKAIAKTGGCIGVSVHSSLLSDGAPTIDDYIEHIEYMVKLLGDDFVTLGADFIDFHLEFTIPKLRKSNPDGRIYHHEYLDVPGLESYRDMGGVLDRLRQRGFSDESIEKIAWRNWMRVLQRVSEVESGGGTAVSHFAIGEIEANPGKRSFGFLNVAPMAGGGSLRVPVHIAEGRRDGPTLGIICTQHGEEVMPLASIRQVLLTTDLEQLNGRLVVVPVANPIAFVFGQRSSWVDALYGATTGNLNRLWPGKVAGFFTERLAWAISQNVIRRVDALIDFHSGTPDELLLYYAYYPDGESEVEQACRALAEAFGMEILMRRPEVSHHLGSPGSTLTEFMLDELRKPVVTVELGEFYGLRPNGEADSPERPARPLPNVGVDGIRNVMCALKMLPGAPTPPAAQVVVSPETRCLPDAGGLLYPEVTVRDIGRVLPKGTRLGRIMDAQTFEILGEIRTPYERNLLVSARVGKPVSKINPGDQCFHVANFDTAQWIKQAN